MARKKKEEIEYEDDGLEDEMVEDIPESHLPDLPPRGQAKINKSEMTQEDRIVELKKELAIEEAKIDSKKFVETAPKRMEDLELAVKENRVCMIKMLKTIKAIEEDFNLLVTEKK